MAGLVPFNKKNKEISTNTGFEDFYNVLDDFFSNDWPFRRSLTNDTFKVDVEDNGNEYLIEAEVPGIDKKDINVELNDGKLMIDYGVTFEPHVSLELCQLFRGSCATQFG